MLHEVRSSNQCLTGRVFKTQILLLRKKKFPTVNFCFYIILAVFHLITFGSIWAEILGLRKIKESKKSINFEVDLIPASCYSSFPVANLKGNVFEDPLYSPRVTVIAFILVKL